MIHRPLKTSTARISFHLPSSHSLVYSISNASVTLEKVPYPDNERTAREVIERKGYGSEKIEQQCMSPGDRVIRIEDNISIGGTNSFTSFLQPCSPC